MAAFMCYFLTSNLQLNLSMILIFCFTAAAFVICFKGVIFMVQRSILLSLEGTTMPLSFVSNILLAYAHDSVGKHLAAAYDTEETQVDISLLRSQVRFSCHLFL